MGARFFRELSRRIPGLDDWYHQDADGTPWDDGVRADDAQVDTGAPDGLSADCVTCGEAVELAAEWFRGHVDRMTS